MEAEMEFNELIKKRRSIRKYRDKEIPADVIQDLIQAATLAPSAGNGQPWRFIIVNNRAMMKRISDESKKNILDRIKANPDDYARRYQKLLGNEDFNVFYNAPCLVLILGEANRKNIQIDCTLAASYLMMAAANNGFGTCWVNLGAEIQDPDLKAELGIPKNTAIVAPIILGLPEVIPSAPGRKDPIIYKVISG
jgi:nitroreductase